MDVDHDMFIKEQKNDVIISEGGANLSAPPQ